jgi:exopolysaccharide biosynthesis polyprenyl glycosylphosphotransferase
MESKAFVRFRLGAGLLAVDCAALIVAFCAAGELRFGAANGSWQYLLGAFLPIYLISAAGTGSYSGPVMLCRKQAIGRGLGALLIAASAAAMVMFFLQVGPLVSRFNFGAGLALAAVFVPAARYFFVSYAARRLGNALFSVVELRDGVRSASQGQVPSFDTAKFFDPLHPTPESLDRLAQLIANVDRVVVSCPDANRAAWAHVLQGMNVHGEIIIPSAADVRPLGFDSFAGKTTLLVGRGPLTLRERISKRLFDLTLSLGALLVLWPLLLLVALLIKLDSPGPVIFRQARIGRQNRLFYVRKFRSMYVASCDGAGSRSTARGDARITRVGNFIRKTSIDELPQLFDVLLGKMSIVGPRPHAVSSTAEDRLFWEIDSRYWHRHACKPGITGLAQIRGFRGSTTRVKDISDRLASDLEYLAQWSLWQDCLILLQTVRVISHKNAY